MKIFKEKADKERNAEKDSRLSLIPVTEKEEKQLRDELEDTRRQAEARIQLAREQAEQKIDLSQHGLLELIAQKRKQGLEKARNEAQELVRSSEQLKEALHQQIRKNMPKAVQSLVNAVTTLGDIS